MDEHIDWTDPELTSLIDEVLADVDSELYDEDDGQPDEMQEWYDFDPDC